MPLPWTNFMMTAAEASAALTGLVIVAVSVNINRILSFPHLPARAGATVATLILIVVVGMAALIPQNIRALGAEVILFTAYCWLLQVKSARYMLVPLKRPKHEVALHITLGQVQTLPFIAGGIALSTSHASGFYYIAGGVIAIFIFSTLNAWVLLVEILR